MKTIIDTATQGEICISLSDLPMLIHGREKSGASMFSISVAALLHMQGVPLLIFTAYPMAKEEFLQQVGEASSNVFYLEQEDGILKAQNFQTIIVASGNEALFLTVLETMPTLSRYVPFVKNIEVVTELDIVSYVASVPAIISGDVTKSLFAEILIGAAYVTRVLFTPFKEEVFPGLAQYQAKMVGLKGEKIVSLQ